MHLTWLDLSYNQLTEVEGLARLTRLQDLSLHRNQLKTIDALADSPSLVTLSLGAHLCLSLSSNKQMLVVLPAMVCEKGNCWLVAEHMLPTTTQVVLWSAARAWPGSCSHYADIDQLDCLTWRAHNRRNGSAGAK